MDYIKALQNKNLKVTPQRLEIIDILYQDGHINIDNLYLKLKVKFPTLSLATIYKNINRMKDKGLISEVKVPNQKTLYELTKKEHSHIICQNCNCIIDIDIDTSSIINQATQLSDYQLNNTSIVFSGLCPKCA